MNIENQNYSYPGATCHAGPVRSLYVLPETPKPKSWSAKKCIRAGAVFCFIPILAIVCIHAQDYATALVTLVAEYYAADGFVGMN